MSYVTESSVLDRAADGGGVDWDPAPVWSPAEERILLDAARDRPPDRVEGWTPAALLSLAVLRSPRAMLARLAQAVALVALVVMVVHLARYSDWGQLARTLGYPMWTVGILLIATAATRSLGAGRLARFWLVGAMLITTLAFYLAGPLTEMFADTNRMVSVIPWMEEGLKLAPVAALLLVGRWTGTRYGLTDLLVVGYLVGFGYMFTEDALWDRATPHGFDSIWGLLTPGLYVDSLQVVAGHAVWTALMSAGLALVVVHWRRQPVLLGLGVVLLVLPVLDHMKANDWAGDWPWVHHLVFFDHLTSTLFAATLVLAVVVDRRTLQRTAAADHLLPQLPLREVVRSTQTGDRGWLLDTLDYIRQRNAVWYRRAMRSDPWPAHRGDERRPVLRRLGRTARAAGLLDGRRPADRGWAEDPVDPRRLRWFHADGWSPYVATTTDDGTTFATDPAPGRPHARRQPSVVTSATWWRDLALVAGAIGGFAAFRILTGSDVGSDPGFMFGAPGAGDGAGSGLRSSWQWSSLPDAPNKLPGSTPWGGPPTMVPGPGPDDLGPGGDPDGDPPSDAPPPPDDPLDDPPEDCP